MEKVRIGLCDDESVILGILKRQIETVMKEMGTRFEIETFLSGQELLSVANSFHLVFLDLQMPEIDGIEVGKRIRMKNPKCKTIIATGQVERFKEAFRVNAFRFITKPFCQEEVEEAIRSYLKGRIGREKISVYQNRVLYNIEQRDITYLLAYGSYIEVMTDNGIFRKEVSLSEMEKQLENEMFFRVHRKYIVNMAKIDAYRNGIIWVNEKKIEVARRKRREFEQKYLQFDLLTI